MSCLYDLSEIKRFVLYCIGIHLSTDLDDRYSNLFLNAGIILNFHISSTS